MSTNMEDRPTLWQDEAIMLISGAVFFHVFSIATVRISSLSIQCQQKVQSKVIDVTYIGRHVESLYEIKVIYRQSDKTQVC
jgi:hypothetical protein